MKGDELRRSTDITVIDTRVYFLPVHCEEPLTFGGGSVTSITCCRAAVTVRTHAGKTATGWGEVPLNAVWAWPAACSRETSASRDYRDGVMRRVCIAIGKALRDMSDAGHPFEVSRRFMAAVLPHVMADCDTPEGPADTSVGRIPDTVALLCMTPFDIALYDAFGMVHESPVIDTLGAGFLAVDLSTYFPAGAGSCLRDSLAVHQKTQLPVWHLVGYSDRLAYHRDDDHNHRRTLSEWILRDGLQALKIKLLGRDLDGDIDRCMQVFAIGAARGIQRYSLDLNGSPVDESYIVHLYDRLERDSPEGFARIAFVEEPFPLESSPESSLIREVARRKPLYIDERATGWESLRHAHAAGWTGVALKTCKTLTGSLLSLAWARHHGMPVVVQDLTNPMLAQLTHLWFASYADEGHGVESNAMQFYPGASEPEARVHPGAYRRRNGMVDISTLRGPGFGYRLEEVVRELPPRAA